MTRTSRTFERFDRAVLLGMLGALLLAVVGIGEARAAVAPVFAPERAAADGLVQPTGVSFCDNNVQPSSSMGEVMLFFGDVILNPADLIVSVSTGSASVGEEASAYTEAGFEPGFIALFSNVCDRTPTPGFDPATYTPPFSSASFTVTEAGRTVCEGVLDIPAWSLGGGSLAPVYGLWTVDAQSQWTYATFGVEPPRQDALETFMAAFSADFTGERVFRPWNLRVIDCTTAPVVVPVSTLALSCDPASVSPGAVVTCMVTGGDPEVEILWRASASPAFAGQGVRLDAEGRGSFSFRVPGTVTSDEVLVELVEWDRTATVMVSGPLVPTSVPAGQGSPSGPLVLLGWVRGGAGGRGARRTALEG
jgi:hypothetical protein